MDHRLKSIYGKHLLLMIDALDNGNYKTAITLCNKWIKKAQGSLLLLAYALDKIGHLNESIQICDQIMMQGSLDESIVSTLTLILRNQARYDQIVTLTQSAYEASDWNEEYGKIWVLATVRARDFKQTQAVSMALFKKFKNDQYMYWYIMSLILQVEAGDPNSMMLLTLGEKMMDKCISQNKLQNFEELDLYAQILIKQNKWNQLKVMLLSPLAQKLVKVDKDLKSWILQVLLELKEYDQAYINSINLLEKNIDDWKFYEIFITCLFHKFTDPIEILNHGLDLFEKLKNSEEMTKSCRSPFIAKMYLYDQLFKKLDFKRPKEMKDLIINYLDLFGAFQICYQDLQPFLGYFGNNFEDLVKFLNEQTHNEISVSSIRKHINSQKIIFFYSRNLRGQNENLRAKISLWMEMYIKALDLGVSLDEREMQYGDDYILLIALSILEEYAKNREKKHFLFDCLLVLEYALERSKFNFYFKLIMTRLYLELNDFKRAIELYESLEIKQIQNETLSYIITDFCHGFGWDLTAQEILLSSQSIYRSNIRETPEMIVQAFKFGTYSKISEFCNFCVQLDKSLNRVIFRAQFYLNDLIYKCKTWDDICSLLDTVDIPFLQTVGKNNRDYSVIPTFSDHSEANVLKLIHGDFDIDSERFIRFSKTYFSVLKSWKSSDVSQLKNILNDLNNLESHQFKTYHWNTIEIIKHFTGVIIGIFEESSYDSNNILEFLDNTKAKFEFDIVSNPWVIHSRLLIIESIFIAFNAVLEALKAQGMTKINSTEISKSVNSLKKYFLGKISEKRDQMKGDVGIGCFSFSDLFDPYMDKDDKRRRSIVSSFKNYWSQSLSDNFTILQGKAKPVI